MPKTNWRSTHVYWNDKQFLRTLLSKTEKLPCKMPQIPFCIDCYTQSTNLLLVPRASRSLRSSNTQPEDVVVGVGVPRGVENSTFCLICWSHSGDETFRKV